MFLANNDVPLRRLRSVSRAVKSDRAAKSHLECIGIPFNNSKNSGDPVPLDADSSDGVLLKAVTISPVQTITGIQSIRELETSASTTTYLDTAAEMESNENWLDRSENEDIIADGDFNRAKPVEALERESTDTTNAEPENQRKRSRAGTKVMCHVCHRQYDAEYIKVHARIHTGERPFTCAAGCQLTFATRNQHINHYQRHHGDVQSLECDICHRRLASKASLKEHKRTHSDEKPYCCQQCDKSFKQLSLLSQHLKSHRSEQPFKCPLCPNRSYKSKRSMQRHHEAIHDGVRHTFQCEVCGKVFSDSTALRDHSYVHRGDTPHACSYCGRKFLSKKVMNLHVLIHENKKPYQCEICGLFFRQRCVLKRHLLVHSGIKSHTTLRRLVAVSSSGTKEHPRADIKMNNSGVEDKLWPISTGPSLTAPSNKLHQASVNNVHEDQCQSRTLHELDNHEDRGTLGHPDKPQAVVTNKEESVSIDSRNEFDMGVPIYIWGEFDMAMQLASATQSAESTTDSHREQTLPPHSSLSHLTGHHVSTCVSHNRRDASEHMEFSEQPLDIGAAQQYGEASLPPFSNEGSSVVNNQLNAESVGDDSSVDNAIDDSNSFMNYPSILKTRSETFTLDEASSITNKQMPVYVLPDAQLPDNNPCTSSEELVDHVKITELFPVCNKNSLKDSHQSSLLVQLINGAEVQCSVDEESKVREELDDELLVFASDSEDVIPSLSRNPVVDEDDVYEMITEADVTVMAVESKVDGATAEPPKRKPRGRKSTASRWLFRRVTTLAQCKSKLQKKLLNSKICQTREAGEDQEMGENATAGNRQAGVLGLYRSKGVGRTGVVAADASLLAATITKKRAKRPFRKVTCHVCHKEYYSDYMKVHARIHTGEKPFACAAGCPMTFATCNQHRIHHQRHHGKTSELECDVCHRVLASKASLKEHKRTHSEEKPYSCQQCDKTFKQLSLLSQHLKSHRTEQPFQCEQCGTRYKTKRGMERHRRAVHEGLRPVHPCQLCDKVFGDSTALKDHMYRHRGETPHVCSVCDRKFTSRKVLNLHLLIHEHKKPYVCDVENCGKAFRQRCVLKRHMSVHTGIKPFHCDTCDRGFIHAVYLRRHSCQPTKENKADAVVASNCA